MTDPTMTSTGVFPAPSGPQATVRALVVRVGERTLALDTRVARGVAQPDHVTTVPRATRPLLGLITVRSQAVPLVHLAGLLDPEGGADGERVDRVVVIEVDGHTFAVTVDDVSGFTNLPGEVWTGTGPTAPETTTDGGVRVSPLHPRAVLDLIADRVRLA